MILSTTILTLATLLAPACSLPAPAPANLNTITIDGTKSWPVTNFKCPGGSPAGCVYSFNLIYKPSHSSGQFVEPAINTFCNGTNIQETLRPCEDPSVSTNVVNGFLNSTLIIQHTWHPNLSDGSPATVWIVGNYTWTYGGANGYKPPTTFNVPQLEEYAIA